MIHTLVLSLALASYDLRLPKTLCHFLGLRQKGTGISGITAQVNNQKAPNGAGSFVGVYCNLFIDALLLTGKRNLDIPGDDQLIAALVDKLLAPVGLTIADLAVYRIDYCYNAFVPDRHQRELLMWLWGKCDLSGGNLRLKKYSSTHPEADPGVNNAYFSNHLRTVQLYDKEAERTDKRKQPQPYEEGVLRLEYQTRFQEIRNAGNLGFWHWVNADMARSKLGACAGVFFSGDFYSIRAADRRLEKAGVSPVMRARLHGYMVSVARYGIRRASSFCKPAPVTEATARSYRAILEAHGICPVTIPKHCGVAHIANPFRNLYGKGVSAA